MARVLVIDDNTTVRAVSRAILESVGYEVLEAADGTAGLDLLWEHGADLVLCDLLMPGQEGLETLRQLRLRSDVPVIIMSGQAERLDGSALFPIARLFGATNTLRKPFGPAELLGAVHSALECRVG
ncbi:MAG: response regulator [Planctomycetes bacterium]|nr:response regulator [Planctomycetota bacterium]